MPLQQDFLQGPYGIWATVARRCAQRSKLDAHVGTAGHTVYSVQSEAGPAFGSTSVLAVAPHRYTSILVQFTVLELHAFKMLETEYALLLILIYSFIYVLPVQMG